MGWDIWAVIDAGGEEKVSIGESYNYTYNTSGMLYDVGIDWKKLTGKRLSEVLPVLEKGLEKLKANPTKYEAMNPENGWGNYDGLVKKISEIIEEYRQYPNAELRSWL